MRQRSLRLGVAAAALLLLGIPALAAAADGPNPTDIAVNSMWVVIAAILVLFMQAGFAMLEIGLSRMKNAGAVAGKIVINLAITFLMFWAILVIIGSFFRGTGFNFVFPWKNGIFFEL